MKMNLSLPLKYIVKYLLMDVSDFKRISFNVGSITLGEFNKN